MRCNDPETEGIQSGFYVVNSGYKRLVGEELLGLFKLDEGRLSALAS